jgi:GGDEF domain-containing protein
MPDQNHFWDRLTMECRRAMTLQKTLSLLLVKAKPAAAASAKNKEENSAAWSDAAKALSRKLRPSDSIYRLAPDLFALVLPETDSLNAKRIAVRLQEELQEVRAKHGKVFDITVHNYPEHVKSSHELEDIVKSLLPEQEEWAAPTPASAPVPAAVPVAKAAPAAVPGSVPVRADVAIPKAVPAAVPVPAGAKNNSLRTRIFCKRIFANG